MSQMTSGLAAKRLEVLKEAVPAISRVLVLSYLVDPIAPFGASPADGFGTIHLPPVEDHVVLALATKFHVGFTFVFGVPSFRC